MGKFRLTTHEEELQAEREYVAGLYERLDAERARVKGRYRSALRGPVDQQNGGAMAERDDEVRALARQAQRLDVADDGLCFGRLDAITGERSYVGRIGLLDESNDYEPLLIDWRRPRRKRFISRPARIPRTPGAGASSAHGDVTSTTSPMRSSVARMARTTTGNAEL